MGAVGHQLEGRHAPFPVRKYALKTYCRQLAFFPGILHTINFLSIIVHTAGQFTQSTVTVSAESVDGPTPAARVTWNTTVPPECVTSVMVEFRTKKMGPAATTYTTTNTSQTEIIQTGLECPTDYYIRVIVTGQLSDGSRPTVSGRQVQVLVGGNKIMYMWFIYSSLMVVMPLHRYTYASWSKS